MNVDDIELRFAEGFNGQLIAPGGTIAIGGEKGGMQPYHLLFGALGSCFYATFLSVATKKRLTFKEARLTISGHKRDTIPPMLDHVEIHMVVSGASDEKGIRRSAELGAEYCSIHATISKVAEIVLDVSFV